MPMNFALIRDQDDRTCTLGRLILGQDAFHTIERPWIPNAFGPGGKKGISCVAVGAYRLVRHDSEAHPKTWALVNPTLDVYHQPYEVPLEKRLYARTAVLIHVANWAHELRGCIAPGFARQLSASGWQVTQSRAAVARIQELAPWVDHTLEIEEAKGISP